MNTITAQPKRLAIVASYFYPRIGGLETIAYTTGKEFQRSGDFEVVVITSNYDGSGLKKEIIDGMTVYRLPITFTLSNTPINFGWYWQVKKILQDEKIDIVQTHSPVPYLADVAVQAAKKLHIPTVATYHAGSMKKGSFLPDLIIGTYESVFLPKLFKNADAIVAVAKNFIVKKFPQFQSKISFIPTGVDVARFVQTPIPEHDVVTFVGRIETTSKWKGIDQLLKAMAIVVQYRPNAKVALIGGGDAIADYRLQARSLGIDNALETPGPQYADQLVAAYQRATMIVLPSTSDSEAFSVALVEAMASGRPIVGTAIGGTPQVIDDEKIGLLVPPKDPVALASAIERILSNRVFAQRLGDAGAAKAQQFTWEIQNGKYREIYNRLLL